MTPPFTYPATPHARRHGPGGYADYPSYRPWLRDEFTFRCVYCLLRERWVLGGLHIDHFSPVALHPELATTYDNLLYACASCNAAKRDLELPDPTAALLADSTKLNRRAVVFFARPMDVDELITDADADAGTIEKLRGLGMACSTVQA